MVVLASSSSVYGGSDGTACRENQPVRPRGGYATSKVEAERLCGARAAVGGAVVVARLFTVAGEGQRPDMALSRWITDIAAGRPARVYGSLERTRDITDVRDVCAAMLALAEHQASGIVNIGTGTAHMLGEMLEAVGAVLVQAVTVDLEPVDHDDPDATLADPTRLLELTGVRPHTDLAGLVRRQAAAAVGHLLPASRQRPANLARAHPGHRGTMPSDVVLIHPPLGPVRPASINGRAHRPPCAPTESADQSLGARLPGRRDRLPRPNCFYRPVSSRRRHP
jgi:hypothetical protein